VKSFFFHAKSASQPSALHPSSSSTTYFFASATPTFDFFASFFSSFFPRHFWPKTQVLRVLFVLTNLLAKRSLTKRISSTSSLRHLRISSPQLLPFNFFSFFGFLFGQKLVFLRVFSSWCHVKRLSLLSTYLWPTQSWLGASKFARNTPRPSRYLPVTDFYRRWAKTTVDSNLMVNRRWNLQLSSQSSSSQSQLCNPRAPDLSPLVHCNFTFIYPSLRRFYAFLRPTRHLFQTDQSWIAKLCNWLIHSQIDSQLHSLHSTNCAQSHPFNPKSLWSFQIGSTWYF